MLEVILATAIAGIAIFALMEAFNRSYFGAGQVEDYTLALSLSQERMEQIRDTPYASVTSSARSPVTGFSEFERQVIVTTPQTDLKQVEVRTYWNVRNGENNVSLTTYAANA